MKAEKYFNELMNKTTTKGRRTLKDVKMICDYLEKEGIIINVSLIGRELRRQGSKILEQSIRNNKKLMEYIKSRISEQKIVVKKFSGTEYFDEKIRSLQHENMCLRALLRSVKLI